MSKMIINKCVLLCAAVEIYIIDFSMVDIVGRRTTTNNFRFVLVCTNLAWRIDNLILDGESVKTKDDF